MSVEFAKTLFGFLGFLIRITEINWQNFLGRFEGSNKGPNLANSAELQGPAQIFVGEAPAAVKQ